MIMKCLKISFDFYKNELLIFILKKVILNTILGHFILIFKNHIFIFLIFSYNIFFFYIYFGLI